jgi:hypothetical protein
VRYLLPDSEGDQKRRVEDVNRAPRRLADRAECGRAFSLPDFKEAMDQ